MTRWWIGVALVCCFSASAARGAEAVIAVASNFVEAARFTYALGRLGVWSADAHRVQGDCAAVLRRADYRRLALANPEVAPYGAAAVTVLERLHLRGSTQARWGTGENGAQTLQFIATGNAVLCFVARAQFFGLPSARAGSYCEVDEALYPPISQQALLLKRGAGNAAAEGFVRYLRGAAGAAVIKAAGYGVPIVQ